MIIHNATVITWGNPNQVLPDHAIRVENDRIREIARSSTLLEMYPREERFDAGEQLLMPGLICAHTHFYSLFSRGLAIYGEAPADFIEILQKLWWPLDQSLLEEDIYYSALLSVIDAIKHGTTTVFDHHASPNAISGSLDIIEKAVKDAGIRASLCYEVTDRGGLRKAEQGIEENLRMIEKTRSYPAGSLVTAMFGLHAGLTLSDETLRKSKNLVQEDIGFHIHVAEHQSDEFHSTSRYGKRVIDRLDELGITGPESIFVHGVHLDTKELEIIRKNGTWLTHQPRSNMNNAVGMADVSGALRFGIPVCIGNDGFSFTMWDEWRTCYLAHKLWNRDPRSMPGNLVIEMGAVNNAKIASHFFRDRVGVIETGAKADLILVDYQPITELTEGNLPWHILFGFRDSMVTTTMIDGKIVMRDRVIEGVDEGEVARRARSLSKDVWKRYQKQF
jgi:putative selenium metabolism protein SsnA